MFSESSLSSTTICVACLSSERKINLVYDEECKQMFHQLLDNLDHASLPITLCFECTARLHNAVDFKRQVTAAHRHLISFMKDNEPLTSLSTLRTSKLDSFDWTSFKTVENVDIEILQKTNCISDILPRNTSIKEKGRQNKSTAKNKSNNAPISDSENDIYDTETLQDDNLQCETLQVNNLQSDTLLNGGLESNFFTKSFAWDVKTEENDSIGVKIEPIEEGQEKRIEEGQKKRIEVVIIPEKIDYSFNDSDDEPLHNIKTLKSGVTKIKKEKKVKSSGRRSGVIKAAWVSNKLERLNVPPGLIDVVVLTMEELRSERECALSWPKYTRHEFRCEHCIVGFNHRFKLDAHMKKHDKAAGDLECEICKTRFKTNSSLVCHRRRHLTRWRCVSCGALYSRAAIAADHSFRAHHSSPPAHKCHVCDHTDTSLSKLRAHLRSHAAAEHCEQCGKQFRSKASLKTHLFIHTEQKDFKCEVCNKKFRFKKALETHRVTHQPSEFLYCAECDMNFKNQISFYQHINYSMKHIHPDKIKYACEFCPRRFSKPARLQEHRHSIHLKLAPHACTVDGCTFASASRSALRTHIRMVHRDKRLERNHVCHTCGKAYTTKKILEGHVRSHTGERPFSCTRCVATFSHSAALYNHNKLVHKVPFVRRQPAAAWRSQDAAVPFTEQ